MLFCTHDWRILRATGPILFDRLASRMQEKTTRDNVQL